MAAENSSYRAAHGDYAPATPPKPASAGKVSGSMKATALTLGLVLLSRVLGQFRDILLAYIFGQDGGTTIYRAAFRVPDLIALVIAGGGLSAVFIPVFAEYWNDKREEDAWKVFGTVMNVVMMVVAVLVGVMELGVLPLTHLLQRSFSPQAVVHTAELSRILLPAQWFLIVGGFMMGTLYARKRFLVPALGPIVYNLGTIIGAMTQLGSSHPQMSAMAWGTSLGAVGGSFVLPSIELMRIGGVRWQPKLVMQHEGVQRVGRLMVPVILGLSLGQLIMWITGGCLPDDERLSALTNAYNLTQAPIGIFAQAFAIVLLPTISDHAAEKRWGDFRKEISQGIRRVLFLTIPASLLMSVLALPLIRVLYEHGKMTDASAQLTATALLYYSLGTFAWSSLAILARGFYARQETWTPLLITTPMVAVFYFLVRVSLFLDPDGLVGLALAASIVGIATMLFFLYFLQKRVGHLGMTYVVQAALRALIASIVASIAAYFVTNGLDGLLGHKHFLASLFNLVVSGVVGIGLYWFVSLLFRSKELQTIGEMFRKRR